MSYSLYLYPTGPVTTPLSKRQVAEWLYRLQLISAQDSPPCPATERLMEYVNYLGCSPIVAAGELHASILIHYFDQAIGLGGESVITLRFPGCGHPIDEPAPLLQGKDQHAQWTCPTCGEHGELGDINWRKSAAFARCFIEITGIFPKEALPNDPFLDALARFSGGEWAWFYSKSSGFSTL
jgi:hypothetical protein